MRVDQPRHHRTVLQIDDPVTRGGGHIALFHRGDFPPADDNGHLAQHRPRPGIDQPAAVEYRTLGESGRENATRRQKRSYKQKFFHDTQYTKFSTIGLESHKKRANRFYRLAPPSN